MKGLSQLITIIEAGYDIEIKSVPKRMDIDGVRDWCVRFTWEASTSERRYDCEWEGFKTAEECVEDLIKTLS